MQHARVLAVSLSLFLSASSATAADIFVNESASTGAGDGSSWADAFQGSSGLLDALEVASAGDRIFVAQGTYFPSRVASLFDSFTLLPGVEIYGGFLGGESDPTERPPFGEAPTVLSGRVNGSTSSFGSQHVVVGYGSLEGSVMDGLTITGGTAESWSGQITRGGGVLLYDGARTVFRHCTFEDNEAVFRGGAVDVEGARPTFIDCRFIGNDSGYGGGAIAFVQSIVSLQRCTFLNNTASFAGAVAIWRGGIGSQTATVISHCSFVGNMAEDDAIGGGAVCINITGSVSNNVHRFVHCTLEGNAAPNGAGGGLSAPFALVEVVGSILWGNTAASAAAEAQISATSNVVVSGSIVEGGFTGIGNSAADPQLIGSLDGRPRLAPTSPAIDAGDNGAVSELGNLDVAGYQRFVDRDMTPDTGVGPGPVIDLGAREFATLNAVPYCTSRFNSSGLRGRIFAAGSDVAADNALELRVGLLPVGVTGLFLTSSERGFVANPGGSAGDLCLGGAVGRYAGPGQIWMSDGNGAAALTVDLGAHPQPTGAVTVQVGDTWNFQAWHRDSAGGAATSNFTDGVTVRFQ